MYMFLLTHIVTKLDSIFTDPGVHFAGQVNKTFSEFLFSLYNLTL